MKIIDRVPFLFGKIKIWDTPVFDLGFMESDLLVFKEKVEAGCGMELDHPYVKPPDPKTFLGKNKETIRFDHGVFHGPDQPDLLHRIEFGFGECGYFYDVHMNASEMEYTRFQEELNELISIINTLEKNIETNLDECYFKSGLRLQGMPCEHVSNFDMTVEVGTSMYSKYLTDVLSMASIIKEGAERIVPDAYNVIVPMLKFEIASEMMYRHPPMYARHEKRLPDDRFLVLYPVVPRDNIYQIASRGIDIGSIGRLLQPFF